MFARSLIFFVSLVLLWTGFPVQSQLESGAVTIVAMGGGTGEAEQQQRNTREGWVDDHHLDDQPAHSHAESGLDPSELIPVRDCRAIASWLPGWDSPDAVRARIPLYLDRPQRPPDAHRFA